MIATIESLTNRLQALLGEVKFWPDYTTALDSPLHLIAIGEHNHREYSKIESMDEERRERIWSVMWNIVASGLQTQAIEKYGNTDMSSIRQCLMDWQNKPENKAFIDKLIRLAQEGVTQECLTNEGRQEAIEYLTMLPIYMMEVLIEETSRFSHLPRLEAQPITIALADMMKEGAS